MKGPLKTTFIGFAEQEDYFRVSEKQNQINRFLEVKKQEKEKSKLNVRTMKEIQEFNKQSEEFKAKEQEYYKSLELIAQLKKEREEEERKIGEGHRQAIQQEEEKQRKEEEKQRKMRETQDAMKERTLKAVEWKRGEEYNAVGKYKDMAEKRRIAVEESLINERRAAQEYQAFLSSQPQIEEIDPLEYDAFAKKDAREGYYSKVDFSKTCFHNPAVKKHGGDGELLEDAIENAKLEHEKKQEQNMQRLMDTKKKQEEQKIRGEEALKKEGNYSELQLFKSEMHKARIKEEKEKSNNMNQSGRQRHSEKPTTSVGKDLQEKEDVEKAFEQRFLQDKGQWTKQEITETKQEPDKQKKQSSKSDTKNSSLERNKSKGKGLVNELERTALEKGQKNSNNIKIYKKPPLDTNAFNKNKPQKDSQQQNAIPSDSRKNANLNEGGETIKQIKNQSPVKDQQNNHSDGEDWESRKKRIKFVDKKDTSQNFDQSEGKTKGEFMNEFSPYASADSFKKEGSFQQSDTQKSPQKSTQEGQNRDSIKAYIKEQEDYLKKLEEDRKNIRERMKQEEEALLNTLQKATTSMESKNRDQIKAYESDISEPQYYSKNGQSTNKKNSFEIQLPTQKKAILIEDNNNNKQRQIVYSSTAEKQKKASALLNQFLSDPKENNQNILNNYQQQYQDENEEYQNSSQPLTTTDKKFNEYYGQDNSWRVEEEQSQASSEYNQSQDSRKRAKKPQNHSIKNNQNYQYEEEEEQKEEYRHFDTFSPDKSDGFQYQKENQSIKHNSINNGQMNNYATNNNNSIAKNSSAIYNSQTQSQSKDLIELTDSLMGASHNSVGKNSRSNQRKWEVSPGTSELSYSVSDIDKSADKTRGSQLQSSSLSRKQSDKQDNFELSGTAKFAASQPNSIGIDYRDEYNEESDQALTNKGESLADMFKKKKAALAKKYEEERQKHNSIGRTDNNEVKKERTKEDILRQRKEMMKPPQFLKKEQPESSNSYSGGANEREGQNERKLMPSFHDPNKLIKEPPQELMDRLANGQKVKVDKKDYLKLTNKNYEQLPEVKRRKEEEQKREEQLKRQENIKQLSQSIKEANSKSRRN